MPGWDEVPDPVLRPFMVDLRVSLGAVKAAEAVGITRTAFNNYIHGRTATQARVRARLASYYLRATGQAEEKKKTEEKPRRAAERRAEYGPETAEEALKRILPPTREAAHRWVDQLMELLRRHPGEAPPGAAELEPALRRLAEERPPEDA